MAKFRLSAQSDPNIVVDFDKEKVTIGRSRTNDFVIEDATVSRYQADISFQPEGYILSVIGNAPVYVNEQVTECCVLQNEDVISFGSESFTFTPIESPVETDIVDEDDETFATQIRPAFDQTLVGSIPAILTALNGDAQGSTYALDKPAFVIGRSEECDITIPDHHVSRKHLVIEQRETGYYLRRLTENQIVLVNNQPIDECKLFNSDQIDFFNLSFAFKSINPADQKRRLTEPSPEPPTVAVTAAPTPATPPTPPTPSAPPVSSQNEPAVETARANLTTIQPRIVVRHLGPRLVSDGQHGDALNYRLSIGRNLIGRDLGCDVVLKGDNSVSRAHAVIERQEQGHVISVESGGVLLLNGKKIKRASRVYSGDTLQLGDTLLTFLSEQEEDVRPAKKWILRALFALTLTLAAGIAGAVIYRYVWLPWNLNHRIEVAEQRLQNAEYSYAVALLKPLLKENLDAAQQHQAASLLAISVNNLVDTEINKGFLEPAKIALEFYLRQYGADEEASIVWRKLNEVRYLLGQKYESEKRSKIALTEYLAIDSDSDFYGLAQKAISNIWLESQKIEVAAEPLDKVNVDRSNINMDSAEVNVDSSKVNVDSLLLQAEVLFAKKHYLSPINNNAYVIYAQVLNRAPTNAIALAKIEEMKTFYRVQGSKYCRSGNKKNAETYFRRYLIIEPENADVQTLLGRIDQCVVAPSQATSGKDMSNKTGQTSAPPVPENRQKIRKLLEEEGVESEWIVDYLFDEPESDTNTDKVKSDTPW